jgi:hypothetical protein
MFQVARNKGRKRKRLSEAQKDRQYAKLVRRNSRAPQAKPERLTVQERIALLHVDHPDQTFSALTPDQTAGFRKELELRSAFQKPVPIGDLPEDLSEEQAEEWVRNFAIASESIGHKLAFAPIAREAFDRFASQQPHPTNERAKKKLGRMAKQRADYDADVAAQAEAKRLIDALLAATNAGVSWRVILLAFKAGRAYGLAQESRTLATGARFLALHKDNPMRGKKGGQRRAAMWAEARSDALSDEAAALAERLPEKRMYAVHKAAGGNLAEMQRALQQEDEVARAAIARELLNTLSPPSPARKAELMAQVPSTLTKTMVRARCKELELKIE